MDTINIHNTRGSEWRKWDLHIHSNVSDGAASPAEIIEKAVEKGLSVIALTDHHTVKNIEETKRIGKEKGIEVITGIEFRTEYGSNSVHMIGLFPENLDCRAIYENILCPLGLSEATIIAKGKENSSSKSDEVAFKDGMFLVQVEFKKAADLIHKYGGLVSVHAGSKTNTVEQMKHQGNADKNVKYLYDSLGTVKEELMKNYIDICEIRKENDSDFFYLNTFGLPSIITSDAHTKDEIGNKFTWIKADPTFEGLKQILYEPEERVKIQDTNPVLDFEKPYFDLLTFREKEQVFTDDSDLIFDKSSATVPLNPNLVTIIGGRGEGKSMLTEYLSTSFYGKETNKEGIFRKSGNIDITYCKTIKNKEELLTFQLDDKKHAIDFIYINQGNLKNIVEDKQKKSKLANSIFNLAKINKISFNETLNKEALVEIKNFHKLSDVLDKKENKIDFLEAKEKSTKEFIDNITTQENKDKLEKYSKNLSEISDLTLKKTQLEEFRSKLLNWIEQINEKIEQLNNGTEKIPLIEVSFPFKSQIESIDVWVKEISDNLTRIEAEIGVVKQEFSQIFKGDLATLLQDVDKYQKELFDIRQQIREVKAKTTQKEQMFKMIFTAEDCLISQIKNEYENQKLQILSDWQKFSNINEREELNEQQKEIMTDLLEDLKIDVIVDFDEKSFYEEIKQCINGTYYRNKNNDSALRDYFKICDFNSFFEFIKNNYLKFYPEQYFYDNLVEIFFDEKWRSKFIKVFPILKYKNKDLNKISVGQKGTVYLKMMLATEAFSKPIIFDQPEDDLDNEFIVNHLIELFKKLKKYRQVIIVTHNANLVVNADAEQIIVASNDNGKLSYFAGALENPTINQKICDILEGGKKAFEKREKKYGFKK
jgi:ABC-type cobalamin/Fe3+-siderophores transport system ATPase subunit